MGIIQAAIPLFFLLIALELVWAQVTGRRVLRLNDSLSDLSCGILSQLAGIFTKLFTVGIFIWVADHARVQRWLPFVAEWPERAPFIAAAGFPGFTVDVPAFLSWAAVFTLVDLAYYFSHRYAHEINILWAGHVVHHSSEEYNLPVALRQSALHGLMSWVFYVPLALMGVPWRMFLASNAINLVYQFWIHTRAIGTMGRATEWIMNTPSHHRVHHGVNPEYQDKNYAGVFIIWDRMFGTFEPEVEEPVYGITKPLNSWNPLWANVHVFVQIARDAWRARRWADKLRIVFGRPGWRPPELGPVERPVPVSVDTFEKFDPPVPAPLAWYGFVQFAAALVAGFLLLQAAGSIPIALAVAPAFFIAVALAGVGGVFERAKWARPLETARLLATAATCGGLLWTGLAPGVVAWGGLAFCLVSLAVLWAYRAELTHTELAPLM
jgi:alkylglycerol monooxygenase